MSQAKKPRKESILRCLSNIIWLPLTTFTGSSGTLKHFSMFFGILCNSCWTSQRSCRTQDFNCLGKLFIHGRLENSANTLLTQDLAQIFTTQDAVFCCFYGLKHSP